MEQKPTDGDVLRVTGDVALLLNDLRVAVRVLRYNGGHHAGYARLQRLEEFVDTITAQVISKPRPPAGAPARVPDTDKSQARVPAARDPRLAEAHQRIDAMSWDTRSEAAVRLSRSYSCPRTCVEREGCKMDCGYVVWPDGERWPARVPDPPALVVLRCEDCGTDKGVTRSCCPYAGDMSGKHVEADLCSACHNARVGDI